MTDLFNRPPNRARPNLLLEMLGLTSARQAMVNVSDGGHTGDNLGLLPLLRRRCSTILVSDAEADSEYSFESFNNAVRMAFIEENIQIKIDLTPIQKRKPTGAGTRSSEIGVCTGKIFYPRTSSRDPESTGRLIYVKASLPLVGAAVDVLNYAKEHKTFPHETTADQFFDDAQFEAHRSLGHSLGEVAAAAL